MKPWRVLLVLCMPLLACSEVPTGQATLSTDGGIEGNYPINASLAEPGVTRSKAFLQAAVYLYESPAPGAACPPLADGGGYALSTRIVGLDFATALIAGLSPGVYPVIDRHTSASGPSSVEVYLVDSSLPYPNRLVASGVSGSVTLTEVGQTWAGTFSGTVEFQSYDDAGSQHPTGVKASISGTFDAPLCSRE